MYHYSKLDVQEQEKDQNENTRHTLTLLIYRL